MEDLDAINNKVIPRMSKASLLDSAPTKRHSNTLGRSWWRAVKPTSI